MRGRNYQFLLEVDQARLGKGASLNCRRSVALSLKAIMGEFYQILRLA